jgi:hypothetical protein
MNPLRLDAAMALPLHTTETSAMKSNHAKRDLLMAVAVLLVAASACVYGFIKIVPLAMAHSDTISASTSAH